MNTKLRYETTHFQSKYHIKMKDKSGMEANKMRVAEKRQRNEAKKKEDIMESKQAEK